jgi:catecholate siderophore receptor
MKTTLGKGRQQLREMPRSIASVINKVMDDGNLDAMRVVPEAIGGINLLAAEGGEEGIRKRCFSLR